MANKTGIKSADTVGCVLAYVTLIFVQAGRRAP